MREEKEKERKKGRDHHKIYGYKEISETCGIKETI